MEENMDKYLLVAEYLKTNGLVRSQLDSFNFFVESVLEDIIIGTEIRSTLNDKIYLRYLKAWVGEPSHPNPHRSGDNFTPQECRLTDLTYAAPIYVTIQHREEDRNVKHTDREEDAKVTKKKETIIIGRLPIMLRSCRCKLNGKDEDQQRQLRECPLDPGGYFVIKGEEKVILIQERLQRNRIMIDADKKDRVKASVISSTKNGESTTIIAVQKEKFYLKSDQFRCKIPIMILMKAMGMASDQEVLQLLGRNAHFHDLLLPSILECTNLEVYTQAQALVFLENDKFKVSSHSTGPVEEGARALRILRDKVLAHVPVHENNFHLKCLHVAVMLRRIMEVSLEKAEGDDKDYLGNKQYELCGDLLPVFFEGLFMQLNNEVSKNLDALLAKKRSINLSRLLQTRRTITVGLERALSTGNWRMHKKGVTQVVSRLSFIGLVAQMTRVVTPSEVSGPGSRAVHGNQVGMICPCDTPVGEACGLVKHLALMTHITPPTDEDESRTFYLVEYCSSLGVESFETLSPELHAISSYIIILNGVILGKHRYPKKFANQMRKLRRNGQIGKFVSIFVNEKQGCVYIASDGGRVCRPLVIAEEGVSRIKEHHMKELEDGVRDFSSFLRDGLIEFLDVNEENNSLIALCEREATPETTHIEVERFTILGVSAGMIPYIAHNSSVSSTYQCAIGKQVMGNIAYNQANRMDALINLLVYPQCPLVTTRTAELVGYDNLGAGQNAIVAVMSYDCYNSSKAFVMNKSSVDRGFGRCIVMKRYSAIRRNYANLTSDEILRPQREGNEADIMQILDDDGLAAPGEIIRSNDVYINKESPTITTRVIQGQDCPRKQTRQIFKGPEGETNVVDKVALYADCNDNLCIELMFRHTRRPEIGDKFSCRHGQKGICGLIVQQEDFPFSECGICPDLIINPHEFLESMIVGKMKELLGSKAGAVMGEFKNGTAFASGAKPDEKRKSKASGPVETIEAISQTLVKHGYSYSGKDFLYSGTLGTPLKAYIFTGPLYYQKLKHMVMDKIRVNATGPRDMITRQPTQGIRMGEMERDCLVSYGASMVIHERLMISSDPFEAQICQKCGLIGYYDYRLKIGICSMCRNGENISAVKMPYAFKTLIQELQSMNIVLRFRLGEPGSD